MNKNKVFQILVFSFFSIFFLSCNLTTEDPSKEISEWKTRNDNYFKSMKDSTSYTSYIIPNSDGIGYYYKILKPGDPNSTSPLSSSLVKVNYKGELIDGKVFDKTYKTSSTMIDSTATPIRFNADRLILGWTLNLMQMKVGEIRRIVLPYELAYGTRNDLPIKPYSTLIFDIQLISYE